MSIVCSQAGVDPDIIVLGGGPNLTDVSVIIYLLFTEWNIPRELKFTRREGESKLFRGCHVRGGSPNTHS